MTKQFLYIVDPLAGLNVKTDTTLALMQEAEVRGFRNFACEIKDIFIKDGKAHFLASPIEIPVHYQNPPQYLEIPKERSVDEFSVVFMRKDPPVDEAFLASLLMLRCYDAKKTVMINEPDGLLIANEKLFGQKVAPSFFPKTIVACARSILLDFVKEHGRVVIKPLNRAGGSGVLVMEKDDRNLGSVLELLTLSFSLPVMMQAFIKNARLGDKRIMVVGGKALGAIMRVPHQNDHRANFHAGGMPKATAISEGEHEIVDALAKPLMDFGLHLVGIDVIDGYLTEINVTSPTGVLEIEGFSQNRNETRLRMQIMDYVETLIA